MTERKPVERPPIVEIEWVDSMGYGGWNQKDRLIADMDRIEDMDHVTVGYLLKRTAKYIGVTQSMGRTGSIDQSIQIPRCAIRSVRVIK